MEWCIRWIHLPAIQFVCIHLICPPAIWANFPFLCHFIVWIITLKYLEWFYLFELTSWPVSRPSDCPRPFIADIHNCNHNFWLERPFVTVQAVSYSALIASCAHIHASHHNHKYKEFRFVRSCMHSPKWQNKNQNYTYQLGLTTCFWNDVRWRISVAILQCVCEFESFPNGLEMAS